MPSQDELRALWVSGVPLDRAWLEFTPDNFDAFMLRLLQTHPANDDMFEFASDEAVRKRYAELKAWLPMNPEGRQTKLRIKIDLQRSYLFDKLFSGELWAIGYRTLSEGSDELARVPRHLFFTDYEHSENSLGKIMVRARPGTVVHASKPETVVPFPGLRFSSSGIRRRTKRKHWAEVQRRTRVWRVACL